MKISTGPKSFLVRGNFLSAADFSSFDDNSQWMTSSGYFIRAWDIFASRCDSSFLPVNSLDLVYTSSDQRIHQPEKTSYSFLEDGRLYGSILGNIPYFWNLVSPPISSDNWENNVLHITTKGVASYDGFTSYEIDNWEQDIGYPETVTRYLYQGQPNITSSDGSPDTEDASGDYHYRDFITLLSAFDSLTGSPLDSWTTLVGSRNALCQLTSYSYEQVDDHTYQITYSHKVKRYWFIPSVYSKWDSCLIDTVCTVVLQPYGILRNAIVDLGPNDIDAPSVSVGYVTFSDHVHGHESWDSQNSPTRWGSTVELSSTVIQLPLTVVGVNNSLTPDSEELNALSYKVRSHLKQKFSSNFLDIYGSSTISSSQAVDSYRNFVQTNYLESLSEIGEVYKLIPNLEPIRDFLKLVPKFRILTGLLRLADFAANTYLLTKFGLEPFVNDIKIFANEFDKIESILSQRIGSPQTLYGKFSYTFPEGTPLYGATMVTRSKIRVKFGVSDIQQALLPLSLAGLEPSPSTLWDLVPFSFVPDWFTNTGDKIRVGENAVYMLSAQLGHAVHSYTIYGELDNDVLNNTSFSPYNIIEYKIYNRRLSKFYPFPGHSSEVYDWLGQSNIPLLTGMSLVWALLRA